MGKADRKAPARAMAQLMASLDGSDYYGIPPLTAYQRFNSVGGDVHGQCAVAQGARGYRVIVGAGLQASTMIPKIAPVEASAGFALGVAGARIPTSLVVLFRLPNDVSMDPKRGRLPLALAQVDGVSWTGDGTLRLDAKVGAGLLSVLASADVELGAKARVTMTTTKLAAESTAHFANAARSDLAAAVDDLLVLEAKRAAATILSTNASWFKQNRSGIALDTGVAGLKMAYAAISDEHKEAAQGWAVTAAKDAPGVAGDNWEYVLAGTFATAGAALAARKVTPYLKDPIDRFLGNDKKSLLEGLRDLLRVITAHRAALLKKPKPLSASDQAELDGVEEAMTRLYGFIDLVYRPDAKNKPTKSFAPNASSAMPPTGPVGAKRIKASGGTTLKLTSWDWELSAGVSGQARAVTIGKATYKKEAPLVGRSSSFRFEMDGAGNHALIQDTQLSLMQMTIKTARATQWMHTGVDTLDKAIPERFKSAGEDITDLKLRCFGAMAYQSANVYLDRKNNTIIPGLSGLALGVSIRLPELCAYADEIGGSAGSAPLSKQSTALEKWVQRHLGCEPADLRSFVQDAELGATYLGSSGDRDDYGIPADALLLEVTYVAGRAPTTLHATNADDLFKHYVFTDTAGWKQRPDVRQVAMRLRYRIQSKPAKTSVMSPYLGVSPFNVNFQFGRETEVGQEAIVDLHAQFAPELEKVEAGKAVHDQFTKNELTPPAVALFNRG